MNTFTVKVRHCQFIVTTFIANCTVIVYINEPFLRGKYNKLYRNWYYGKLV